MLRTGPLSALERDQLFQLQRRDALFPPNRSADTAEQMRERQAEAERRQRDSERIARLEAAITEAIESVQPMIAKACNTARYDRGPTLRQGDIAAHVAERFERYRGLMQSWAGEHYENVQRFDVLSKGNLDSLPILARMCVQGYVHDANAKYRSRRS
jgi:hypothetical protein